MNNGTLQIILDIIIIGIGLYLALVKSYFKEKGKNLATKEDIGEITSKVENVKSEIELLTHRKMTFEDENDNHLLNFMVLIIHG